MTSPFIPLIVFTATSIFVALIYGEELANAQKPLLDPPEVDESGGGFFEAVAQAIDRFVGVIVNTINFVWGILTFFVSLLTFNVEGAPWYIRVLVGGLMTGSVIWIIVAVVKPGGNG